MSSKLDGVALLSAPLLLTPDLHDGSECGMIGYGGNTGNARITAGWKGQMATKKLTVNLPESALGLLKELAQRREITLTEALRQSIEVNALLRKEVADGAMILVERQHGPVRQLVLH